MQRKWAVALAGLAALALTPLVGYTEEWPKWLGPRGDGISHEQHLLAEWPAEGPKLLWSQTLGGGFSTPIAVNNKLYVYVTVGKVETLACLDAADGHVLWTKPYKEGLSSSGSHPGTRATPTLEGDRIYLFSSMGELACVKAADGDVIWSLNVLKETGAQNLMWGTASSPLVAGDVLYVQGGKGGPVAVAVNKNDGKILWKASEKGVSSYAAPILIDVDGVKQLVVMGGQVAYGLNAQTGEKIWSVPFKTGPDINAATPIYRDHRLFITGEYGHGCQMLEVSATDAKRLWPEDRKTVQCKTPSPILDGNVLYANSSGTLKCVSWPEGEVKWEDKAKELKLGPGGSLLRYDDKLILLGETGRAYLVKATPEGMAKISEFEAIAKGKEVWATPLVYNGRLYLKGNDDLRCYDISAK